MRYLILFLALSLCQSAKAQYPDGTLVFSSKTALVGRIAKRITGGDQYTHVAIILGGRLYESDWPRAKVGPINSYKRTSTNDYYLPKVPYSPDEVARMMSKANTLVGRPYDLKNYRRPGSRKTCGTWCSPFVGQVLNASGRYHLSRSHYYEPQNLLSVVSKDHDFRYRVKR